MPQGMNITDFTITIKGDIDLDNYSCSQGYLLLPVISEYTWNHHARVVLYLVGILWCFLGVAHIADIFMAAIEKITSKTRTVRIPDPEVPDGFREVHLKVWNDTVANLSLLALGTSAPEILLSVIEITGNNFESGELGPGTIVGSAAFNLLFISAICITCVPDGEIRRIQNFKVFGVTSFTCVFAYVWMVIVLLVITPNVIDIWEAVLTFAFFPLLLLIAYAAEKDFFLKKKEKIDTSFVGIPVVVANGDVGILDETHPSDVVANGDVGILDETHPNDVGANGDVGITDETHTSDGVPTEDLENTDDTQASEALANGDVGMTDGSAPGDDINSEGGKTDRAAKQITDSPGSQGKQQSVEGKRAVNARRSSGQSVDPVGAKRKRAVSLRFSVSSKQSQGLGTKKECSVQSWQSNDGMTKEDEEIFKLAKGLARNSDFSRDRIAYILTNQIVEGTPHNRGWYRSNAIRGLTGGKKLRPSNVLDAAEAKRISSQILDPERAVIKASKTELDPSHATSTAIVEFTSAAVAVLENQGVVRLGIKRTGCLDISVSVRALTINGTAFAEEDYKPYDGIVVFKKNETLKDIYIDIVDDNVWEPDEFFFVKLKLLDNAENVVLGSTSICEVTIINDDEPGVIEFSKPSFVVKESEPFVMIPVIRKNGADGEVLIKWVTSDITAIEGTDYQGKGGEIVFNNNEINKNISIPLIVSKKMDRDDSFQVEITEVDGGALIGNINKTIVTIISDEAFTGLVSRILNMTKANQEALELRETTYQEQFVEAMNVNGGDLENATFIDYLFHFLSFFWKFIFAFIPPTKYCGGWITFIISLSLIGLLTAVIGDMASIFGCLIGLEDSITAITLVALGTSMPDTFASKTAAIMEKTADSAIGNVNGSNSVNVFLGLGLPWMMASVFHYLKGENFIVKAGSLGFSVIIYSLVAVIGIAILIYRRMSPSIGAELGGPKCSKIFCSIIFLLLWAFYIVISALQTKEIIKVQIG